MRSSERKGEKVRAIDLLNSHRAVFHHIENCDPLLLVECKELGGSHHREKLVPGKGVGNVSVGAPTSTHTGRENSIEGVQKGFLPTLLSTPTPVPDIRLAMAAAQRQGDGVGGCQEKNVKAASRNVSQSQLRLGIPPFKRKECAPNARWLVLVVQWLRE